MSAQYYLQLVEIFADEEDNWEKERVRVGLWILDLPRSLFFWEDLLAHKRNSWLVCFSSTSLSASCYSCGKLNMESILILLLKRRPAYSLKKLIFGGAGSSCRQTRTIFQVFIRPWCVLHTTNTANRHNFHIGLQKGLQSVTN